MGNGVAVLLLPLLMIMESFGQLTKWSSAPLALLNFAATSIEASSSGFEWKRTLPAAHAFIKLLEIMVKQETMETPLSDSFILQTCIPAVSVWISILVLQQKFSDFPGIGIASDGMDRCTEITSVRADHCGEDEGFFGLGTVLFVALYLLLYSVVGTSSKNED